MLSSMITRSAPDTLIPDTTNPFAPDAIAEFRAGCEEIISRGGENADLAASMLRISSQLAAMNAEIEAFLNSPTRA